MTKKKLMWSLLSGLGMAFLKSKLSSPKRPSGRGWQRGDRAELKRAASGQAADAAARRYLMYMVMPVWATAGFLDWLWHRQTNIETTSGTKESWMHLVMMAEAGLPILTGLFLEMNAGALALMSTGWLLHEATVAWDVRYTISRRKIYTREQLTHGYMETIPFNVVATMACLHPEQALALVGMGAEKPDFKLRFKQAPVPLKDFAMIVGCMGLVSSVPHLEELWRCYRAEREAKAGTEIPECAREMYAV
jgi:hypothetical protein